MASARCPQSKDDFWAEGVPFAVLHIPHSSTYIPPEARASILLSDQGLARELVRMTDWFTNELFQIDSSLATSIIFPVSRLVVDPERFLDDDQEPMAKRGMGAVYTRTSDGRPLRLKGNNPERGRLLAQYYHPHHQRLTDAVQAALDRRGLCLIVDCHSFCSTPLPHEPDQDPDRPDICLGTDEFHSPKNLIRMTVELFEKSGFRTALNRPFAGALVPEAFYRRDSRVHAIMIEVNRNLYLAEATGHRPASFTTFKLRLHRIIIELLTQNKFIN